MSAEVFLSALVLLMKAILVLNFHIPYLDFTTLVIWFEPDILHVYEELFIFLSSHWHNARFCRCLRMEAAWLLLQASWEVQDCRRLVIWLLLFCLTLWLSTIYFCFLGMCFCEHHFVGRFLSYTIDYMSSMYLFSPAMYVMAP